MTEFHKTEPLDKLFSIWTNIISPESIEISGGSILKSLLNASEYISASSLFPVPKEVRAELWLTASFLKEKEGLIKLKENIITEPLEKVQASSLADQINKEFLSKKRLLVYENKLSPITELLALELSEKYYPNKKLSFLFNIMLRNESLIYAQVAEEMNFPKGTLQIYQLKIVEYFIEACLCLAFSNLFSEENILLDVFDAICINPTHFLVSFIKKIMKKLQEELAIYSKEFMTEKIPVSSKNDDFIKKMVSILELLTKVFRTRIQLPQKQEIIKQIILESIFPEGVPVEKLEKTIVQKTLPKNLSEKGGLKSGERSRSSSNNSASSMRSGLSSGTKSGGNSSALSGEKTLKKSSAVNDTQITLSLKTSESLQNKSFQKTLKHVPKSPNSKIPEKKATISKGNKETEASGSKGPSKPEVKMKTPSKSESKNEKLFGRDKRSTSQLSLNQLSKTDTKAQVDLLENERPVICEEKTEIQNIERILKRNELIMDDIIRKGNSSKIKVSEVNEDSLQLSRQYFQTLLSKAKLIESLCEDSLQILNALENLSSKKVIQSQNSEKNTPSCSHSKKNSVSSLKDSYQGDISEGGTNSEAKEKKFRRSREERRNLRVSGNNSINFTNNTVANDYDLDEWEK